MLNLECSKPLRTIHIHYKNGKFESILYQGQLQKHVEIKGTVRKSLKQAPSDAFAKACPTLPHLAHSI
jgi:hypothetical protein